MSHFCLDPEVKELALGIVREAVQGFIDQGYALDPNAAKRGEIKFIEPEPNEPECKHENKTYSTCLVAHPPDVSCERGMDCGEYVVRDLSELKE